MSFYSRRPFWMRHTARAEASVPRTSIPDFQELISRVVNKSEGGRILALCGAGLSASSGLPTFRGAGGLWRRHEAASLATPEAFAADPGLVWLFYAWRRHAALRASPNRAHLALAALARRAATTTGGGDGGGGRGGDGFGFGFLCLTQNVDGLSQRAGHPPAQLRPLHGSLLDLACAGECGHVERGNADDPLCPALAAAARDPEPDWIRDADLPAPPVDRADLPRCPRCKVALLRPGVVWFGEALDGDMLAEVDAWIADPAGVDVMLVVGTAAAVQPAAGYVWKAKRRGAVVAVVNPDPDAVEGLGPEDYFFQGDAAELLPRLLEKVIGPIDAHAGVTSMAAP